MRFAGLLPLFLSLSLGQQPGHGSISGTVVEASNSQPIRKVIVTLTLEATPRTWATTRTDDSGRFTFQQLPAGKYTPSAAKTGSGSATYGANSVREVGEVISLIDGETRAGLTLRFIHPGEISGRVFNAEGDPVQRVEVQVLRTTRNLGELVVANYRSAITDDRGEYHIPDLDPAQYYLRANPDVFMNDDDGSEKLSPQYYGGAREWKISTVLNVHSGDKLVSLDFHLIADQHYPIHGHVTGVPDLGPSADFVQTLGAQPRGVEVMISPAGDGAQQWTTGGEFQPPDYTFDFSSYPGDMYHLNAFLRANGKLWSASQIVDSRQPVGEVVLALIPAVDIKGQLRIEGEPHQPVTAVRIALNRQGSGGQGISVTPAADGTFTLPQVAPGEWTMTIAPLPQGGFIKSVLLGDKDFRFARLVVEPGSDAPLHVVLSTRSAKIEGQVDAASGDSKRAGIVLAPVGKLHNLARFYYGVVTADDGKFQMQDIAPGKYKIFALEKLAPLAFRNPEAEEQLDPLGQEIDVAEGATLRLHPKLIPTDRAREALPKEIRQ